MTNDPWQNPPAPADPWGTPAPAADPWGAPPTPAATQPPADPWSKPPAPAPVAQWQDVPGVDWTPAPIPADFDKDEWKQGGWDANSQALSRVMGNEPGDVLRYFKTKSGECVAASDDPLEIEQLLSTDCVEITADEFTDLKAKIEAYEEREREWTEGTLMGAEERGRFINALNETRGQEYVVSQDGELDRVEEYKGAKPTGVYIAYRKPESLLHAVLSGPYDSIADASLRAERAFQLMSDDNAFKLAFDGKFVREGLYYMEIPLSQRRKGAYGKL